MSETASTELTDALTGAPVLGIVRTDSAGAAVTHVGELARGGLRAIEISLSTPDALAAFTEARRVIAPSVRLGVGTVRTAAEAVAALTAGAQFLVSPNYSAPVVARAREAGIPIVCGVLTPTEIQTAADDGVEWLKVFPAASFGPGYLRNVKAPFADLRFVPTGGIAIDDVGAYRRAGAAAVGLAGALVGDPAQGGAPSAAAMALAAWEDADER